MNKEEKYDFIFYVYPCKATFRYLEVVTKKCSFFVLFYITIIRALKVFIMFAMNRVWPDSKYSKKQSSFDLQYWIWCENSQKLCLSFPVHGKKKKQKTKKKNWLLWYNFIKNKIVKLWLNYITMNTVFWWSLW